MTFWIVIDGLALLLAGAYGLSLLLAVLPLPRADAALREKETWLRLWFPLLGSSAVVVIGAGSVWWDALRQMADHCGITRVHEPFFCWMHPVTQVGLPWGDLGIGFVLLLAFVSAVRTVLRDLAGHRLLSHLVTLSSEAYAADARAALATVGFTWEERLVVVDSTEALCFIFGVTQPTLVLSINVIEHLSPPMLAAMLAHEQAHVERRETFWRPFAQVAMLLHLPGLGQRAFREWTTASEAVCDDLAGARVGSRQLVAEALIAFQRLSNATTRLPAGSVAFASAGVVPRVKRLLVPVEATPNARWRAWPVLFLVVAIAVAPQLHRALEAVLYFLHAA